MGPVNWDRRKKMASTRVNRRFRLILLLVACAFLWLFFAPETGFLSLLKQRNELKSLQLETQQLAENNEELKRMIEKLKNDNEYLEKLAREKQGMIKENEIIFEFSKKK